MFFCAGSFSAAETRSRLVGIVVDQVGDAQNAAFRGFDELESCRGVDPLPLAQCPDDVLHFPDLVLRAFARIDVGDVDDGLFGRVEDVQDVIDIRAAIEEVADVELLQIFVAVELFVVGVGDGVELRLVLRGEHGFGVAPEVRAGHRDDMHAVAGDELAKMQAELVVGVGGNVVKLVHGDQPVVELLHADIHRRRSGTSRECRPAPCRRSQETRRRP